MREWLPVVVNDIVESVQPVRVIVFGSLARGTEGPDSDADILVVLDHLDHAKRLEVMAAIRRAIAAPIPVDVLVTDRDEVAQRGHINGSSLYWPLREGQILYDRAAALKRPRRPSDGSTRPPTSFASPGTSPPTPHSPAAPPVSTPTSQRKRRSRPCS